VVTVSACAVLTVATSAFAQGKSGRKPGKTPGPPPSTAALPTAPSAAAIGSDGITSTTSPFAWMDDASVMPPGGVWLGVSMVRWHGSGLTETIVPVLDGAIGLLPRLQFGASVPRVAGGLGTTFLSGKIAVYADDAGSVAVAVAPTLEIAGSAAMQGRSGESRVHWGLPVSVQLDRAATRIYGSSGYFSPGIWYLGAGIGRSVADRVSVSGSVSRAWAGTAIPSVPGQRRSEIGGGASYDVSSSVAVFGSVSRTLGMTPEEGAGTTLSVGVSLSAQSADWTK
jgi:hypothetical protein